MEGLLIRMPQDEGSSVRPRRMMGGGFTTTSSFFDRLDTTTTAGTPQMYYYILGEGFLSAFVSPDDMEPVEEFQLTGHHIEVEPIYSMSMFYIRARRLESSDSSAHHRDTDMHDVVEEEEGYFHMTSGSSSSDEDDDLRDRNHRNEPTMYQPAQKSLLLFAADSKMVEMWCNKLKNWNRYCFDSKPVENVEEEKLKLENAFGIYTGRQENYGGQEDVNMEEDQEMTTGHETSTKEVWSTADSPLKTSTATHSEMQWWTMGSSARRRIGAIPPQ